MHSKAHTAPTGPLIKLSVRDVICSAFGKRKRRLNFWTLHVVLDLALFRNQARYFMTVFKNTASGLYRMFELATVGFTDPDHSELRQKGTSLEVGIVHYFNYHTLYRLDWVISCPEPTSRGGTARWTRSSSSSTLSTCLVIRRSLLSFWWC